jgi:hypothetical protein
MTTLSSPGTPGLSLDWEQSDGEHGCCVANQYGAAGTHHHKPTMYPPLQSTNEPDQRHMSAGRHHLDGRFYPSLNDRTAKPVKR